MTDTSQQDHAALLHQTEKAASDVLAKCRTPIGLRASAEAYPQVWVQDAVIPVLGGALDLVIKTRSSRPEVATWQTQRNRAAGAIQEQLWVSEEKKLTNRGHILRLACVQFDSAGCLRVSF